MNKLLLAARLDVAELLRARWFLLLRARLRRHRRAADDVRGHREPRDGLHRAFAPARDLLAAHDGDLADFHSHQHRSFRRRRSGSGRVRIHACVAGATRRLVLGPLRRPLRRRVAARLARHGVGGHLGRSARRGRPVGNLSDLFGAAVLAVCVLSRIRLPDFDPGAFGGRRPERRFRVVARCWLSSST